MIINIIVSRQKGIYYISYAYYDKNGKHTGESEEGIFSDELLYELLKPALTGKSK